MLTFKKPVAVGDALPCRAVNIPPDPETSLPTGKIPVGLLADLLSELPSSPPELPLGPRIGEDAYAIRVPGGVLVAATDPITLNSDQIGRFSVIVNANDVAVMGVRPQWFLAGVSQSASRTPREARMSRPPPRQQQVYREGVALSCAALDLGRQRGGKVVGLDCAKGAVDVAFRLGRCLSARPIRMNAGT
jgi:hypothetical protein